MNSVEYFNNLMNKEEFLLQEMINNKIIMAEEDYVCLECG